MLGRRGQHDVISTRISTSTWISTWELFLEDAVIRTNVSATGVGA